MFSTFDHINECGVSVFSADVSVTHILEYINDNIVIFPQQSMHGVLVELKCLHDQVLHITSIFLMMKEKRYHLFLLDRDNSALIMEYDKTRKQELLDKYRFLEFFLPIKLNRSYENISAFDSYIVIQGSNGETKISLEGKFEK